MAPKNESQKSGVEKKGKSFNDVCSNFTNACSDINMEGDDPTSELLDLLRETTDNAQELNESDLTAVKVVKLLLPAVSVLSSRMVMKTAESQDVKIYKVCAAVRLNRYAIDSQNQYSRRENFRISGIEEADDENYLISYKTHVQR